ncbi:rhomboid family protein [Roseateles depolymerans]|uniref:Peptidase S54 rhomboid domain-containing protein n=1 Tax=Roseateles depolymerans TaxID=76731 RepID=A0A0U3E669_9BURK|nr:hypothetical protein RD2015_4396 [Roseateles depolymerans]REG20930.1 rhomboid family protein [Roseateles depolymerans]
MDAVRRSCRLAVSSWTGFCLVLIGLALMTRTPRYASYALLFGLVAATIATDYFAALRTASGIGERALFFRWMQTAAAPRVGLVAWSLLLGLSGATQLLLQDRLGSLESVVEQYGIVYSEVLQQGQWWRVLSGSFLHAGLAHYANNAMLLLFTGPIVWGLFGAGRSLIIFASGTVVGPLAQMAFGTPEFDSYLGLSSPVLAMFGLLIASAWRNPRVLPKGFPLTLIGIVTVSVVGAELLSERVASSAHVAGLAVGVLFGLRVPTLAEDHRVSGAASRRGAV